MNMLKKLCIAVIIVAAFLLVGCKTPEEPEPAPTLTINQTELSLIVGEQSVLIVKVAPDSISNKTLSWNSSDNDAVSVDQNGVVTAKSSGQAIISAIHTASKTTVCCSVTVDNPEILVKNVELDKGDISLYIGNKETLVATVLPSDASNKDVTWTSSNTKVASVDGKGVVTAKSAGEATITVTTKESGYFATCIVQVEPSPTLVTGISLNKSELNLKQNEQATLVATITPENATNKNVIWSSSDVSIAMVDQSGNVTAKKSGTSVVYATAEDGNYYATCTVTVYLTYKITYEGLDGATNPNPSVYSSNERIVLLAPSPKENGEVFDCWYLKNTKISVIPEGTKENLTLTATWKPGVTFDASEATVLSTWLASRKKSGPFNVSITGNLTPAKLIEIVGAIVANPSKLVNLDISSTTGLSTISGYVFEGCENLACLQLPSSVNSIAAYAFDGCENLATIEIPASLSSIGEYAFSGCSNLASISIPDNVTSIGKYAFDGCCSLTSVAIPKNIKSIGESAFNDCSSIKYIYVDNVDTWYKFYRLFSSIENLYVDGTSVKTFVVPNDFNSIDRNLFGGMKDVTSVTIPDSVVSIEEYAFADCTNLASVTIGNGVTSIGEYAFSGCTSLSSITIPSRVRSIGEYAFYGCTSLSSITIDNSVTSIGKYAFSGCTSLSSVTIPDSVISIAEHAFYKCNKLASVTIGNGVTSIDDYAFSGCTSLSSITIPSRVRSIGEYAFSGCTSLSSITIPDSVTSIAEYAFYRCNKLASVTIGNGVTSIGEYAFFVCTNLSSVEFKDTANWFYTRNSTNTSGTEIDVTDFSKNAINLQSYDWGSYYIKKGSN